MDSLALLPLLAYLAFALVGLLVLGGVAAARARRRRRDHARERLVLRDETLEPTDRPLGLDRDDLAARCSTLPTGDRRHGLEHAVQGPLETSMAGRACRLEGAALRWWWERRQQNPQHSHRHRRLETSVALVRLPVRLPTPIRLRPESLLGRLGVTRHGHQLASREFNRRFRVECDDDRLAVTLLDADLQAILLDAFAGRGIELVDDLLVLRGPPAHRDASVAGVIGELPAVRQDAARLVAAVPARMWRQLGAVSVADDVPAAGEDA